MCPKLGWWHYLLSLVFIKRGNLEVGNVHYLILGLNVKSVSSIKSLMQGWGEVVTPGSLPHQAAHLNRIAEDQRIYLGSVIIITQHHLNVLSRDIGNNKGYIYLYIFIYLSNLRAKDLEYNSSSQKRSISKKGTKMDNLLHKIWLKWSWFLQLLL